MQTATVVRRDPLAGPTGSGLGAGHFPVAGHCPEEDVIIRRHLDEVAEVEHLLETVAEPRVHPEVHEGVVARVAHGQPVSTQPDNVHVRPAVERRIQVASQGDDV